MPLTPSDNTSISCESETSAGFLLLVNSTSNVTRLRLPYPQTGNWYITLRSLCSADNGNLMFVPPVAIAIRSEYLLEASVYIFTMFFSTFYHACDQPGMVVFCIMEYDVLQFCDFLGSLMSVWVTVIAMARLQPIIKQILYLLGAMLLSMALQLDRHGLWNLLGPSLFALGIMGIAWTVRTIRRRHCYPPTWKRWVFYLFPGTVIATSAVALYAFVETEENYFYIHSIWHMLIAGS
ncbi:hypothetical protein scyTo_0014685, partial [Scyliorhinus torazame]|nr:hypothetical protein [Scyliorhinus torazame]